MKLSLCCVDYKNLFDRSWIHLITRNKEGRRVIIRAFFEPYFYIQKYKEKILKDLIDLNIDTKEENPSLRIKRIVKCSFSGFPGNKILKVVTKTASDVGKIRKKYFKDTSREVITYEGDVRFALRYLIDENIYTGIEFDPDIHLVSPIDMPSNFKIFSLDIETLSKRITSPGTDPVIVIGLFDSFENKYVIFYWGKKGNIPDLVKYLHSSPKTIELVYNNTERGMFRSFLNYCSKNIINLAQEEETIIEGPDIFLQFTTYDLIYILTRMKKLKMNANRLSPLNYSRIYTDNRVRIKGVHVLDLAQMYRESMGTPKWETLQGIAMRELGYGRVFHEESVFDLWNTDDKWWRVLARNLIDVELVKEINKKDHLIEYFDEIRRVSGCNLKDAFFPSVVADVLYLRHCHNKIALQSKPIREKESYPGAIVKEVIPGLYYFVLVLDWKSLYPSIIKAANISFETLDGPGEQYNIDDKYYFSKSPKGWSPSILEKVQPILYANKEELKKAIKNKNWQLVKILEKKRLGIKSIVNGIYGLYGFAGNYEKRRPASRLYEPKVAGAITHIGRTLMTEGLFPLIEKLGYNILQGDTDSVFIQLKTKNPEKESRKVLELVTKEMNNFIQDRWKVDPKGLELDIDKIFKSLLIFTRKKYKGITIEGEEITKGLEIIRSNSAEVTVDVQEVGTNMALSGKPREEIKNYLKEKVSKFKTYKLTDIALPEKLSMLRDQYRVFASQLQAFLYAVNVFNLELVEGERFYTLYVKDIPNGYPKEITATILDKKTNQPKEVTRKVKKIGFLKESDIPKGFIIDYDKMIDVTITKKIKGLLDLLGITLDEIGIKKKEKYKNV